MEYLSAILAIGVSFLLGLSFVKYLTIHPLRMSVYLSASCFLFFSLLLLLARSFREAQLFLAGLLSFLFFLAGYTIMTHTVLSMEDSRYIPELKRTKGDPKHGHTAVIYFTHGEPETYNPIGWINQFREFDEKHVRFVPFIARPFFLFLLRKKYLQVGKSNHRQMHLNMLKSLEKRFREEGDTTTKFYIAFLDDEPRPDAAVIQALNEGASRIIVCEVFVTVSDHTAEGEKLIKHVHVEDHGVSLAFTEPLWNSKTLHRMFLARADSTIGDSNKSKVGVLLVGHGQPDEWDKEFPTETEQEILFREEILKLFEADGYKRANLGLAWMSFKEPKPAEKVEELVNKGVDTILFFAAAISADAIHSQSDIPALVYKAKIPEEVRVINMGAWNDDPLVIEALKERIDMLM